MLQKDATSLEAINAGKPSLIHKSREDIFSSCTSPVGIDRGNEVGWAVERR